MPNVDGIRRARPTRSWPAFRDAMAADAFARAREAAIDRLVRERFGLPTIAFV